MSDINDQWHLDRRVPISLILAIFIQTAAFVWFMSSMDARIEDNNRRTAILEARSQERSVIIAQNVTSIAVLNETLRNVEASLQRIELALEKRNSED